MVAGTPRDWPLAVVDVRRHCLRTYGLVRHDIGRGSIHGINSIV
jgi:hypothetical protein